MTEKGVDILKEYLIGIHCIHTSNPQEAINVHKVCLDKARAGITLMDWTQRRTNKKVLDIFSEWLSYEAPCCIRMILSNRSKPEQETIRATALSLIRQGVFEQ